MGEASAGCAEAGDPDKQVQGQQKRTLFSKSLVRTASGIVTNRRFDEWQSEESAAGQLVAMDSVASQLVSFQDRRDLLRGSRLSMVMKRGAAIFSPNPGSASTYKLSRQVPFLHAFISHNWSVSRMKKYFVLAMIFNYHQALVIGIIAILALGAATASGLAPVITFQKGPPTGVSLTLCIAPIFWLALCFGHEVRRVVGRDPFVFLDKTCIHQTDMDMQKTSILKLGAFIQSSWHFVVVYTDTYLRMLWTVYELACFLSLHPIDALVAVPPCMPLMVLGGVTVFYITSILVLIIKVVADDGTEDSLSIVNVVPLLLAVFSLAVLFRHTARMKESIFQRVANFNVDECRCSREEDRPLVYRNIALLIQATGKSGENASGAQARAAFNTLVRERLASPLAGAVSIQYSHIFGILTFGRFPVALEAALRPDSLEFRMRMAFMMRGMCWNMGLGPCLIFFLVRWCGRCVHLTGCWERLWLALGSSLLMISMAVLEKVLMGPLTVLSGRSNIGLIGLAVVSAISVSLAMSAYAAQNRQKAPTQERGAHKEEGSIEENKAPVQPIGETRHEPGGGEEESPMARNRLEVPPSSLYNMISRL